MEHTDNTRVRYAIIRAHVWTNGRTGYHLARGKMYVTESRARKAFDGMRAEWDAAARQGRINPDWLGKFEEYGHRLIEVPAGQTVRETVDALDPEKIFYSGLAV